jgi:formylglycine-generating enzyme required for sulfatase activity
MEELTRRGFVIGTDTHLRVQKLLNAVSVEYQPGDLKYLLCPLFASDAKGLFYEIFERHFERLEFQPRKKPGFFKKPPPDTPKPESEPVIRISKLPYFILGGMLLILIALAPFWLRDEETKTTTSSTTIPAITTTILPDITTSILPETTTTIPPEIPKESYWNWKNFRRIGTWGILIVFLLSELYFYSRRRAVLQKQGVKRPPFVWTIQTPESSLMKTPEFYDAARGLRRRLRSEGTRPDMKKTVVNSLKAGYPVIQYKTVTRPPEYLFLIDLTSYRDHYAHFIAHMADALDDEDVFVTRFFYRKNPRLCFREPGGEQFYLADLRWKYRDCRLILAGDGDGLTHPFDAELAGWIRLFDAWEERAILSTVRPKDWGWLEPTLAEKFVVVPATLAGLAELPDIFEELSKKTLRTWKIADAGNREIPGDKVHDIDALRDYLGIGGFQWLCACAVYPELQWDLTLYLGGLVQNKNPLKPVIPAKAGIHFSPMDKSMGSETVDSCFRRNDRRREIVTEENILRLLRLPYFREGEMPNDLRWKLMREMGEPRLEAVREGIAALFEKNPPPRESFAYSAFRLNLALQDFVFSPKQMGNRRNLRRTMEQVSDSHIAQDYTLLRFAESVPKSGLNLILPERVRKIFYKNGAFVFGLKTRARFGLALCAALLVFMVSTYYMPAEKPADIAKQEITTTIDEVARVSTTTVADLGTQTETSVTTTTADTPAPSITNSLNMTFIYIPPGEFMMGSPKDEPERDDDETQHRVTLTKGFYMQTTEVTQGQWKAVMGGWFYKNNPSYFKDCGDDCPVESVSWNDVQDFIKKLNQKEGKNYRLPTEAEWEYACRAGTTTAYFWGDKADCSKANYGDLSNGCKGKNPGKTMKVSSFPPNAWGLYDMHGNVFEWCQDWYGDYPTDSVTDPDGPDNGSDRVLRGGDWFFSSADCRSASRNRLTLAEIKLALGPLLGFRLAAFPKSDQQ